MAILTAKKVWKLQRARPPKTTMRPCELTLAEQHNVRATVLKLRNQYSSWKALAAALGVNRITLVRAQPGKQAPTVGLALRVARLAGVTVDGVLGGVSARRGRCSTCGK
jgi:DNA-binding XRE family transcriptional regulator